MLPNGDPRYRFFHPISTLIIDTYYIIRHAQLPNMPRSSNTPYGLDIFFRLIKAFTKSIPHRTANNKFPHDVKVSFARIRNIKE